MRNQDESELIAQSLNDNHEAYAELVNRYKNAVYHHCFAIVRREDVAEDIAQETFITAFYKLRLYKPEFKFSTWLFKIATNTALNWLKKTAKEVASTTHYLTILRQPNHHLLRKPRIANCTKPYNALDLSIGQL